MGGLVEEEVVGGVGKLVYEEKELDSAVFAGGSLEYPVLFPSLCSKGLAMDNSLCL